MKKRKKNRNLDSIMLGRLLFLKYQIDTYYAWFMRRDDEACEEILRVIISHFKTNIIDYENKKKTETDKND